MSMYGEVYEPLDTGTESRTKQSFKEESDINYIIAQYARTGLLTPVVDRPPMFIDVSEVGDYRQALENVQLADDLFMDLAPKIRAEFNHSAAAFLDFCSDPDNEDRMRDMGLLPPLPEEPPKGPVPDEPPVAAVDPPEGEPVAE